MNAPDLISIKDMRGACTHVEGMEKRLTSLVLFPLTLATAALLAAACQTTPSPGASAAAPPPPAFVEAACGGCHAVEPPFLSPNVRAPSFEAVANRPGVTRATILAWLVNAHNYPEQMDFDLEREHVEQIADYMITLRRDDYVPIP
ncbi:MAG: hypothetical protein ACX930_13635 [Erythrobacter sp.]